MLHMAHDVFRAGDYASGAGVQLDGGCPARSARSTLRGGVRAQSALLLHSGECVQQGPGLLEVSRRQPFCEPAIDGREKLAGFSALALLLPELTQAQRGTEFWQLGTLTARYEQRLLKTALGLQDVRLREQQQQLTLETVSPCRVKAFLGVRDHRGSQHL